MPGYYASGSNTSRRSAPKIVRHSIVLPAPLVAATIQEQQVWKPHGGGEALNQVGRTLSQRGRAARGVQRSKTITLGTSNRTRANRLAPLNEQHARLSRSNSLPSSIYSFKDDSKTGARSERKSMQLDSNRQNPRITFTNYEQSRLSYLQGADTVTNDVIDMYSLSGDRKSVAFPATEEIQPPQTATLAPPTPRARPDPNKRRSLYAVYEQAKVKGAHIQRERWAQILFEYGIYTVLLAFVYFVLIGMPLWNGAVYWLWWVVQYKFVFVGGVYITMGIAVRKFSTLRRSSG